MLPLRDNVPTRRFAVVTVAIIAANFAVWLFWEKAGVNPGFTQAVVKGSYFPCEVQGTCGEHGFSWPVNVFTSMFQHAGWEHILGNMLFLWIFGNNVEDTLGRVRFVGFYLLGGVVATALQTFITLEFGSNRDAAVPNLGASGAIAAVLGAYFVLLPWSRVLTFVIPFFFFELPAMVFLGIWFLFQLIDGGFSFVQPQAGGGVAFFAHIGGFLFGALTVNLWATGRPRPLRPAYT
ncbi:MAG TPA: rhomboid family intramembrane serine protease [Gaiellaceae bacterium]